MIDIDIQNKSFAGQGEPVLEDVRFSLAEREIVAIVGPSGAGKTTLLNIISGLDDGFKGDISFESSQKSKLNTAMMFQEPRLMPWLSIIDNVTLVADHSSKNRTRAMHLLELVGLHERADDYPGQLSGGMQRRVALARAFLPKPQLVLMDEPFISLDEPSAQELRTQFLDLWEESNSSVLYVTHGLCEAISVADRILFLSKSPAKLILQQVIENTRPGGSIYSVKVQTLQKDLLTQYPTLLRGRID